MSISHLLFFDTTLQAIGQWKIVDEALEQLELFPYGECWYEAHAKRWREEGFEIIHSIASETPPTSVLTHSHVKQTDPAAIQAFLTLCRKQNWTACILSDKHYHTWILAQEQSSPELYQLAQEWNEVDSPLFR